MKSSISATCVLDTRFFFMNFFHIPKLIHFGWQLAISFPARLHLSLEPTIDMKSLLGNMVLWASWTEAHIAGCCFNAIILTGPNVLCGFDKKTLPLLFALRRLTPTTSRVRWPTRSFPSSTRWCRWDGTSSCLWWPTATGRTTWPPTSSHTSYATSRRYEATAFTTRGQ